MQRFARYLTRLGAALRTWTHVNWLLSLAMLTVTAAVVALMMRLGTPEVVLRVGGLILQLLGLTSIARGLQRLRERFSAPSPWMPLAISTGNLWSALLGRTDSTKVVAGSGKMKLAGPKVEAHASTKPPPDAPLDRQIEALWGAVDALQKRHAVLQKETRATARLHEQELKQEREARKAAEKEIREDLAYLSVGGLYLEAIGLACLVVGVVLSTAPQEVVEYWMYMLWVLGSLLAIHVVRFPAPDETD